MERCAILSFQLSVAIFGLAGCRSDVGRSSAAKRKPPSNARRGADDRDEKNGDDDKDKPDTEHIFGFTAGTDVGDVGEKEIETRLDDGGSVSVTDPIVPPRRK